MLRSTAAGVLALAVPGSFVLAQTVVPPSAGPCVVVGTTATCTGDVSAGVDANAPLTVLDVNTLTQDIAPAAGVDGIDFTVLVDQDVTIDVNSGSFSITATNANGIDAQLGNFGTNVTGNLTVTSTGDIAAGPDGIDADVFGTGNITITSTGDITTNSNVGIDASHEGGNGNTTIMSIGSIVSGGEGINAFNRNDGNMIVTSIGNIQADGIGIDVRTAIGNVTLSSTGDITTSNGREGIEADSSAGDVTVTSVGNITTPGDEGIEADVSGNGNIVITSTGNITSLFDGGDDGDEGIAASVGGDGSINITSSGNITTLGDDDSDGIIADLDGTGDITIVSTGNIMASGSGASAVEVDGSATSSSTVTINAGSTLSGGSGTGDGVRFSDGTTNTLNSWGAISASSGRAIVGGTGAEEIFNFGTVTGTVVLGAGANTITNMPGASITGNITTGPGLDSFLNDGTFTGNANLGDGNNIVTNTSLTTFIGDLTTGAGNDTVTNSGAFNGNITLGAGANTVTNMSGGTIIGNLTTGAGNDTVTNSGAFTGNITLGAGNDRIFNSGIVTGTSDLGAGDDILTLSTGSVLNGTALGGTGTDAFAITGVVVEDSDILGFESFTFSGDTTGTSILSGTVDTPTNSINSGTLLINGTLGATGGTTTVRSGATLGGVGTVTGTFIVNGGGTAAPGTSIGTLNINGDVTFNEGSALLVEVTPAGESDRIAATGTAALNGGTVSVVAPAVGNYGAAPTFSILTADAGVTGAFDEATLVAESTFLSPSLTSDGTDVVLLLTPVPFGSVATSQNQREVGGGLDSSCGGASGNLDTACANLFALSAEGARTAFDTLGGEIHPASANAGLIQFDRMINVMQKGARSGGRIGRGDSGTELTHAALDMGAGQSAAAPATRARQIAHIREVAATDAEIPATDDSVPWTGWLRGLGGFGDIDGDGNGRSIDHRAVGAAFGIERLVGDGFALGLAGAYMAGDADIEAESADTDTVAAAVTARYETAFGLGVDAIAGYGYQDIETERAIAVGSFSATASADYDAHTGFGALEASLTRSYGPVIYRPFAGVSAIVKETDGFTESGAGTAGLRNDGETYLSVASRLGLAVSGEVAVAGATLVPSLGVAWAHEFADTSPDASFSFVGGTAEFTTEGAERGRDVAEVEVGLAAVFSDSITGVLSYGGAFSGDDRAHVFSGGLSFRW